MMLDDADKGEIEYSEENEELMQLSDTLQVFILVSTTQ